MSSERGDERQTRAKTASWEGRDAILLVGITGIAAAVRFTQLGGHSMWGDELTTLHTIDTLGEAAAQRFHPPLYYVVLWFWTRFFGTDPAGLRSLAALAGTLTVPVGYIAARRLFSKRGPANVAALALAVLPSLVHFGREARMYSLWTLFVMVALVGALTFRGREDIPKPGWGLYLTGIIAGQLTYHYNLFYAFAFAIGTLLLFGRHPLKKTKSDWRNWLVVHLPLLAAAIVVLAYFTAMRGSLEDVFTLFERGTAGKRDIQFRFAKLSDVLWFNNWAYRDHDALSSASGAFTVLLAMLGVVGSAYDGRAGTRSAGLLALVLILPLTLIEALPLRDYFRTFLPTAALFAVALGYVLWAPVGLTHRHHTWIWVAVLLGLLGYSIRKNFRRVYERQIENWNEACQLIERNEQPDDAVFVTARYMVKGIRYCYHGNAPVVGFSNPRQIVRQSKDHEQVWIVYSHAWNRETADTSYGAIRRLRRKYKKTRRRKYGKLIEVYRLSGRK